MNRPYELNRTSYYIVRNGLRAVPLLPMGDRITPLTAEKGIKTDARKAPLCKGGCQISPKS